MNTKTLAHTISPMPVAFERTPAEIWEERRADANRKLLSLEIRREVRSCLANMAGFAAALVLIAVTQWGLLATVGLALLSGWLWLRGAMAYVRATLANAELRTETRNQQARAALRKQEVRPWN